MSGILIHEKINRRASPDTIYHCLYDYYFLGIKKTQLAKLYARSKSTITNWVTHFEKTGRAERDKVKRMPSKFTAEKKKWILDLYKKRPILYQKEAAYLYFEEFQESISSSTISFILHEAGLSWKVLERRAIQIQLKDIIRFYGDLKSINWMTSQLVFLDEVSFDNRDMLRRRGYAVKGSKLVFRGEFNRKARVSLLCFLGDQGFVDSYVTEGTFDRLKFLGFCREFAREHCYKHPGRNSIWILDGAAIHCDANIIVYLRSLGIIPIFLPAYCPFFNPIEVVFGLMKSYLKEIYEENSKGDTQFFIAKAVKKFSKYDMKPLFRKCGYLYNSRFDPSIGLQQSLQELGFKE